MTPFVTLHVLGPTSTVYVDLCTKTSTTFRDLKLMCAKQFGILPSAVVLEFPRLGMLVDGDEFDNLPLQRKLMTDIPRAIRELDYSEAMRHRPHLPQRCRMLVHSALPMVEDPMRKADNMTEWTIESKVREYMVYFSHKLRPQDAQNAVYALAERWTFC